MSKAQQTDLTEYTAGTTTETITRTVKCPLETSNRKRERVQECVDSWQEILEWSFNIMPSIPSSKWNAPNTTLYRMVGKEFPDKNGLGADDSRQPIYKAAEAFSSWDSNGRPGERPRYHHSEYARLRNRSFDIKKSDGVFGLRITLQPYKPEWFRIRGAEYHQEYLQKVIDGEATLGSGEIRIDGNSVYVNLSISEEVEVYEPADVSRIVGVDLGEDVLYAAAVVDDAVEAVEIESGREFRHYREQLKKKRAQLQREGEHDRLMQCQGEHERYTEHTTNTATKSIVDLAKEHSPCAIHLEDLGDYHEATENPIYDWPRAMMARQICYKATAAGIPVEFVDPAYTSQTCRKCGQTDPASRSGNDFHCRRCGYEVHADVNAAINIAQS